MPQRIIFAPRDKAGSALSRRLEAISKRLSQELPGAKVSTDVLGEVNFDYATFNRIGEEILHGSIAVDLDDRYRIWLCYDCPESAPLADFKARARVTRDLERTAFRLKMPTGVECLPALAAVKTLMRRVNAHKAEKLNRLIDEISESTRELTCL